MYFSATFISLSQVEIHPVTVIDASNIMRTEAAQSYYVCTNYLRTNGPPSRLLD